MGQKRISLVLGSGGARGLAHIGVIRWLEEQGYIIESISGCSMGALIGGIYAAGKLDAYEQWVKGIRRINIVTLLDLAWDNSGLVKGDRIINTLTELVGDRTIEELPIRFTAVAADIRREKEVWIQRGSLFEAIRASISLPMFFTPVRRNGVDLIDGGVLNPVPIAPTFSDHTDMIVAVNLGGAAQAGLFVDNQQPEEDDWADMLGIPESVQQSIDSFIDSFRIKGKRTPRNDWNIYEILTQSVDAMQSTIARQKLAAYPPDIDIEIPRNACGIMEFHRADEMIKLGYRIAEQSFAQQLKRT